MSPAGGLGARRLRGAKGLRLLTVTCVCKYIYEISATAVDLASCPQCRKPTREVVER